MTEVTGWMKGQEEGWRFASRSSTSLALAHTTNGTFL
jgi:hypothetical protein